MSEPVSILTPLEQQKRDRLRARKPLVYAKVIQFGDKAARGECVAPIQLQYDYLCNMRCQHCSISTLRDGGQSKRHLTLESVRSLSRQADAMGLAQFSISGGEPTCFPDLVELIAAIDPQRFYIQLDTNGWRLTRELARTLSEAGVDKVQVSLDSLYPSAHDGFRRRDGAWMHALAAISAARDAGMMVTVSTVVTPQRAHSSEWLEFLELTRAIGVPTNFLWPKPCGEWQGTDMLPSSADIQFMQELANKYVLFDHRTVHFGVDVGGCLAARRSLAVTAFGDVLPCSWIYFSLGNIHDEPLEAIIARGLRYFNGKHPNCRSCSPGFLKRYTSKTYGVPVPVPIAEIMGKMGDCE